jgi:hypothetical protein
MDADIYNIVKKKRKHNLCKVPMSSILLKPFLFNNHVAQGGYLDDLFMVSPFGVLG